MAAKYLFRLDDACEQMNLSKWQSIEAIFNKYEIKPIVAVIPENKDQNLIHQDRIPDFWNLVRNWEKNGWTIGMHGYQHVFHKISKSQSIIPYYDRSEFSGLSLEIQKNKIKQCLNIFLSNKINPTVWVAPAHSFDAVTLKAISEETDIKIISDAISLYPFCRDGLYFIPQQLWNIKWKLFGIWTVCLHPNNMSEQDIKDLDQKLMATKMQQKTISVSDIPLFYKEESIFDEVFSIVYWLRYKLKRKIKRVMRPYASFK